MSDSNRSPYEKRRRTPRLLSGSARARWETCGAFAARDPALVKSAQQLWRGGNATRGIPACAACHSPTGAGIPKNYPRLAGQYADYTYAQLKAFKTGERGADAAGKDVNGRVMNTIAQQLTDAQMKAIADYAAGLR